MDNKGLQSILMNSSNNISLKFGEYQGPLIIDRPVTIDGGSSTLWSQKGSAIVIKSIGVKLKNLKITVPSNSSNDNISIEVKKGIDVEFENVCVNGSVIGISGEEGYWMYPPSLMLPDLKPLKENKYYLEIYCPTYADISIDISGGVLMPNKLIKGLNRIQLTLTDIFKDTYIWGKIYIECKSGLKRVIELYGSALKNNLSSAVNNNSICTVWTPDKSDVYIHI
ncbi:MAG: hypothetical protein Q8900_08780 [Bacillota bacterium]|nr:hypothetical protein [Bacillota bacterium]